MYPNGARAKYPGSKSILLIEILTFDYSIVYGDSVGDGHVINNNQPNRINYV